MQHPENMTRDIIGRSIVDASYGQAIADLVLAAIARASAFGRMRARRPRAHDGTASAQ